MDILEKATQTGRTSGCPLVRRQDVHTLDPETLGVDVQNHTNRHFKLKH